MAEGAGNRYQRAPEPATSAEAPAWQSWFTRAPYPGLIGVGAGLVLAIAVAGMHQPRDEKRLAAATPPPSVTTPALRAAPRVSVSPAPHLDEQSSHVPRVTIQPLPVPSTPAGNRPAGNLPPSNAPVSELPGAANGPASNTPTANLPAPEVRINDPADTDQALPEPTIVPETSRSLPPAPRVITPAPRPAPPVPEVQVPQPAPPPRRIRPARPAGGLKIYFDADSSTFNRDDQRLPLHVEVYVDGRRRLVSDNPEKREFDLGRLPEGRHDIEIVPRVGDADTQPRRETVEIEPGADNTYKAVLHRSHGTSRISKFHPRD